MVVKTNLVFQDELTFEIYEMVGNEASDQLELLMAPKGDDHVYYMNGNNWMQIETDRSSPFARVVDVSSDGLFLEFVYVDNSAYIDSKSMYTLTINKATSEV